MRPMKRWLDKGRYMHYAVKFDLFHGWSGECFRSLARAAREKGIPLSDGRSHLAPQHQRAT